MIRPGRTVKIPVLFEIGRDMLGMLLVTLEYLQARLKQTFELGIVRRWDERAFKRIIDGLVVSDFICDIGFVESAAAELRQFNAPGVGLLAQRTTRAVVRRSHF